MRYQNIDILFTYNIHEKKTMHYIIGGFFLTKVNKKGGQSSKQVDV